MHDDCILDLSDLRDRVGDDPELIREILGLFFEDYPAQLAATEHAFASADASALFKTAHTLKGALANLSAPSARDAARALELAAKASDFVAAREAYARFRQEVERLREACAELQT